MPVKEDGLKKPIGSSRDRTLSSSSSTSSSFHSSSQSNLSSHLTSIPITSSPQLVLKEGWLTKQGKYIRNWRPRWVQLVQGKLYYYKEPAHEIEPTNAFLLSGISIQPNEKLGPYCFELILANRERRYMQATSLQERDAWIQAIRLASEKKSNSQSVLSLPSQPKSNDTHNSLNPSSVLNASTIQSTPSTNTTSITKATSIATTATTNHASNAELMNIDNFEFIKVLGKGNYGKVMLAKSKLTDPSTTTTTTSVLYAIKVVKKSALVDAESMEHLLAENRVLQTIQHPFLVKLYASFQTPDRLYFVMEYVKGGELFYHILKEKKFSETRVQFYMAEILVGLMHLHHHGIVYRDLKLENLLLDELGHIKITDFGLCKEGMLHQHDMTSTFCGTPEYLAPEILEEEHYGRSVDWWALGIVMYELLMGRPPFGTPESIEKLFHAILHSPIPIPTTLSIQAQSLLEALLTRDWTKRLGSGPTDGQEIQQHPFFKTIDWTLLLTKQIVPPFQPSFQDPLDASNFDPEFTQLPAELTPCTSIPEMEPLDLNP